MHPETLLAGLAMTATALAVRHLVERVELSRAKHPSLSGHARLARRLATLIPFYYYADERFFRSDGAPEAVAALRRTGFMRLAQLYRDRFTRSLQLTAEAEP